MQATVRSYDPETRSGTVLLDTGIELPYDRSALAGARLRQLRIGQRVQIEIIGQGTGTRVERLALYTLR